MSHWLLFHKTIIKTMCIQVNKLALFEKGVTFLKNVRPSPNNIVVQPRRLYSSTPVS
jgi:hypothetical protein